MYYMGFSYNESLNLPIWQRIWFIERINEEFKRAKSKDGESDMGTRAAHHNSAETRAMQGRARSDVPAKLRRFT